MRVFVAGASGAVGRRLVPLLVACGHEVTGTATSETSADAIRAMGAEAVVVDGLDAVGTGEAVARAEPDAIIHEMTALSGTPGLRHFDRWFALTNRLRTEGTEHLLAAAKASGVKRFVTQSFTGWSNSREGSWIKTEDDPLDPHPVKQQTETLAAIKFLEIPCCRTIAVGLRLSTTTASTTQHASRIADTLLGGVHDVLRRMSRMW